MKEIKHAGVRRLLWFVFAFGPFCLLGCGRDGTTETTPDPGFVDIVIVDQEGQELPDLSVGAVLVEYSGTGLDIRRTLDGNTAYPLAVVDRPTADSTVYRILVVADESQCNDNHIGCVYLHDRNEIEVSLCELKAICSGSNEMLDPKQLCARLWRR